jgi:hypothetical protein
MDRNPTVERQRWWLALLALAGVALFLLLHPYRGLVHDGRLYTIQALSHLQPELYGNDIFVRAGSQDDYTLFSPLYAQMIHWLGVEKAAATVTLSAIVLFLLAAWMLARTLLPARQALIAVLLLLLLPSDYGPSRIFHYLEEFVTPRQLAEALTLLCLVAWFRGRQLLAALLAVGAMLIHPIIGLVGIATVPVLEWVLPHWRRWWPLAVLAALLAVCGLQGWLPLSHWQFDSQWYDIVMRRTYLRLLNWDGEDWARISTVIATLVVAGTLLRGRLQSIALAALVTVGALLLLAFVGGDLLRISLVVQAQTWRALWLGTVLAILMLVPLFAGHWHGSAAGRCALLLLTAGWIASHETTAMVTAPLAVLMAAIAARPMPNRHSRLLLLGAWATLALVALFELVTARLRWNEGLTQLDSLPPLLDRLLTVSQSAILPVLVLVTCGYLASRYPSSWTTTSLTAVFVAVIGCLAVPAAGTWAAARYQSAIHDSYSGWRARIPPGSDVMWTSDDSYWGDGATNTWLLLERPSFLSGTQAPNALFSRAAAIEMHARSEALWGLLPFIDPFRSPGENVSTPEDPLRLTDVCRASPARYVVTDATMIDATPIPPPSSVPIPLRSYRLYICP